MFQNIDWLLGQDVGGFDAGHDVVHPGRHGRRFPRLEIITSKSHLDRMMGLLIRMRKKHLL